MDKNIIKYPVYKPSIGFKEKMYVNECLDSSWVSSKGRFVNDFESEFCNFTNVNYSTSVCNGTVALHLALVSLGIGVGDEVIVPTLTYIASVNAIIYCGAKPVFVDSLVDTWQIDPEAVRKKIGKNTKAIMCVHLYGHSCDMDSLCEIAETHSLFLIEDCAEALGTFYKGKHVGTFGDVSTFSFYGNKTITTGEGGMVCTNNSYLNERNIHFKSQGLAKHRQYWHDVIGYNYRMTNVAAAIGLAQLENITETLKRKREIAGVYNEAFKNSHFTFHQQNDNVIHSYWMCSILVENSKDRDNLRIHLESLGVETRPLFYPVHSMPMYSSRFESHPIAEDLGRRGLNLPSYPLLKDNELKEIVEAVLSF